MKDFEHFSEKIKKGLEEQKKKKYSIEREYSRDVSPSEFPVENANTVREYLDRSV